MPKFEPPTKHPVWDFVAKQQKEFWDTHKVIKTEYNINRTAYSEWDEYGCNSWVPEKHMYGPYDSKAEAEEHVKLLNADPNLKPREGDLVVRTSRLVETTVTKQFWI